MQAWPAHPQVEDTWLAGPAIYYVCSLCGCNVCVAWKALPFAKIVLFSSHLSTIEPALTSQQKQSTPTGMFRIADCLAYLFDWSCHLSTCGNSIH